MVFRFLARNVCRWLGWCLASYCSTVRGAIWPFTRSGSQVAAQFTSLSAFTCAYLIDWLKRDIARRQQVESDLRASQEQLQLHQTELAHMSRLSIMGEMAASLAHELNQPLHAAKNYARGSVRRLLKHPQRDAELMTALEQIARGGGPRGGNHPQGPRFRAEDRPARFRHFAERSGPRSDGDRQPGAQANSCQDRLRTCPDLAPVMADPIQIEQVVVNLARNGLESMHEVPEEQRVLRIGTRRCDEQTVEVFVRDCGKGISEEDMKRVFEPFFTTKPEGMGMGLAISRSIIQAHEGRLWVTANDDRGCTFHFTLPVGKGDFLQPRGEGYRERQQNSTIFVVDDDPGALESLRWMLEQADYRVKAFQSSREFLDCYRPEKRAAWCWTCGCRKWTAWRCKQALRERKIRLPIIFMTAYGDVPTCAAPSAEERPIFWRNRSTTRCCWSTSKGSSPRKSRTAATAGAPVSATA